MKRGLWFVVLVGLVASMGLPAAGANDEWEFHGGGWGHGVGMSQFGARAMAAEGHSAAEIIGYYYDGAKVETGPSGHWTTQPEKLLIGLVANTTLIPVRAVGEPIPLPCVGGAGCVEGFWLMQPGESWVYEVDPDQPGMCRFRQVQVGNTGWAPCGVQLRPGNGTSNRISVLGKEYAHGVVRFDPLSNGQAFHVVVGIDLETYLYGLAEMPVSFGTQALRAQAITGRSYALATASTRGGSDGSGTLSSCGCHLRSTTDDQVYNGFSAEHSTWKAAVDATAGLVATHPSSNRPFDLISTFYFSSSGGTTENVEDIWGGSSVPWLRAQPDPWSAHPAAQNPLSSWTVVVPAGSLANHLGWDLITGVEVVSPPPAAEIRFTGVKNGANVSTVRSGYQVRSILNQYGFRRDGAPVRTSPYIDGLSYTGRFIDALGHLFESEIAWLANEGITKGCNPPTNSKFCPESSVTRGQMAAFLTRFLDLPGSSNNAFTDDNGHLFEAEINALAAVGITRGCNPPANTRFCPDQTITRGQMAALLVRALGLPNASADHFTDDAASIFQGDINALAESGITKGCNPPANSHFCPNAQVNRGQMAAFLMRANGFIDD